MRSPIELLPLFRERTWGKTSLAPLYTDELTLQNGSDTLRIGEVWFGCTGNRTSLDRNLGEILEAYPEILGLAADPQHPGVCPILVKLLFTSERLSIQVHPDDSYAWQHHGCLGKTEAWYVVDSEESGAVALGFRDELTPDRFRQAVDSGHIENLLDWRPVRPGDVIFTPAGTVHAMGAGLTICEIQENSDLTYRLYDYGRPRELHIQHGLQVSNLGPHRHRPQIVRLASGRDELLTCDYFRLERLRPERGFELRAGLPYYAILLCVKGEGTLDDRPCRAGQAWLIPAGGAGVSVEAPGSEWILTYRSGKPAEFVAVS